MTIIGKRIKHARKEKQYSQAQLAEIIGVSQPTVGNWESGNHAPRLTVVADIAAALEVRQLWLVSGIKEPIKNNSLEAPKTLDKSVYLSTPIVHVPVHKWPRRADELLEMSLDSVWHLPASLWAIEPFALEVDDEAMAREFPKGTIVVFDAARTELIDGQLYLFNWSGSAILRRWRTNPSRLEPSATPGKFETLFPDKDPIVVAQALQSIRHLT